MALGEFLGDYAYLDTFYQAKYGQRPRTAELLFFSTTDSNVGLTPTYLADRWDAYFDGANPEIDKLGADTAITTGTEDLTILPYGSRLRPCRDITFLSKVKNVMVVGIEYVAFDVKNDDAAAADQTAAVNTKLKSSIGTQNNILVQTTMMRTIVVDWEPNFFSPILLVNGANLLPEFTQTNKYTTTTIPRNRGDMSLGTALPYERKIYSEVFESGVQELQIYGFCANYLNDGSANRVRRFPLRCRLVVAYI